MSSDPQVSIVVPARNAAPTIGRTLAGVGAQRDVAYELVVVDDGSIDGTAELARAAGATVIEGPGRGPGQARNAGVAAARAPVIAFLDADCAPQPGWLSAGLAALQQHDLVQGAVAANPAAARTPFDRTVVVDRLSPLGEAANLFVSRAWFDRVGGFEDWLGLSSGKGLGEDTLFHWSIRRAGGRVGFAAAAVVEHEVFPRRAADFVSERLRLVHFPALARRIPELREAFFFRRIFLTARSAHFDLALLISIVLLAARSRRSRLGTAAALIAWARYLAAIRSERGRGGLPPLDQLPAELAADLVGAVTLSWGSLRGRSLLL